MPNYIFSIPVVPLSCLPASEGVWRSTHNGAVQAAGRLLLPAERAQERLQGGELLCAARVPPFGR